MQLLKLTRHFQKIAQYARKIALRSEQQCTFRNFQIALTNRRENLENVWRIQKTAQFIFAIFFFGSSNDYIYITRLPLKTINIYI